MKTALIIILILLGLSVCAFLMPALIGIAVGVALFKAGHFVWAIICIVGGIAINIGIMAGEFGSSGGSTYHEEDCPYCGSGDTDGNHCYNCDEDF